MRRPALAAASVALLAGSLSACGGGADNHNSGSDNSVQQYCSTLRSVKNDLTNLSSVMGNAGGGLQKAMNDFKKLQDRAPAAVRDDWATVNDKLTRMRQILSGAGLSMQDLTRISQGKAPPHIDPAKLRQAMHKMQGVTTGTSLENAYRAIAAHAKRECHLKTP
jgi:hypothetical protein